MILERYTDDTIRAVTSPLTGIQRTCKFPPSIAEFVEFCDEHVRRSTFADKYDERSQKQLREREELERQQTSETAEHRRKVAQRIQNELRGHGFKFAGDEQRHKETPESVRARLNISEEQWNALPDAPRPQEEYK